MQGIFYHGSNYEINKFSDEFTGRIGAPDADGPGIYFTNSKENAAMWGKFTYEVKINLRDFITNKKKSTQADRIKLKEFLDNKGEEYIDNRSSDIEKDKIMAINDAINYSETEDDVWHSLRNEQYNYAPQGFMRAMSKIGIDGLVLYKKGFHFDDVKKAYHCIVYNPESIEILNVANNQIEENTKKKIKKLIRETLNNVLLKEEKVDKILYHGSPRRFKNFSERTTFFSETKNFAIDYAETKSMDYALDEEPNIYEVKVLSEIFNINNKTDFDLLASNLPEKIEVYLTNFPISQNIEKKELLRLLTGVGIEEPLLEAVNAKIGDEIINDYYGDYIIYKVDNDFAYGFSRRIFSNTKGQKFKESFEIISDSSWNRIYAPLRQFIKDYIKQNSEEKYISSQLFYDYVLKFHGKNPSYTEIKDIPSEVIVEFNRIDKECEKELIKAIIEKEYTKKFIRKTRQFELDDTWRYYENDTVTDIIKGAGYGGYVAKERKVNTYAIFNPQKDTEIISYEFPSGYKFNSIEEYRSFNQYYMSIYKGFGESKWKLDRWSVYSFFKQGIAVEDALKQLA